MEGNHKKKINWKQNNVNSSYFRLQIKAPNLKPVVLSYH